MNWKYIVIIMLKATASPTCVLRNSLPLCHGVPFPLGSGCVPPSLGSWSLPWTAAFCQTKFTLPLEPAESLHLPRCLFCDSVFCPVACLVCKPLPYTWQLLGASFTPKDILKGFDVFSSPVDDWFFERIFDWYIFSFEYTMWLMLLGITKFMSSCLSHE